MKILLSACACRPNYGSEPGVGWQWALEIAHLGHEVWVLTQAKNRLVIEAELAKLSSMGNLHFLYYDLPAWAKWWHKGLRGIRTHYFLWQWGAYRLAKKNHAHQRFDLVHHITWVSIRYPSFMGGLGVPFIFGPAGGGEHAPWRLRHGYGLRGWIWDGLRDISNLLIRFSPFMLRTFRQASAIYVTTEQSKAVIPSKIFPKVKVQLAIGIKPPITRIDSCKEITTFPIFRVLYVGRFLDLKGMHLGLPAFASLASKYPNARLTMVGKGPDETRWRKIAESLEISEQIDWIPWVNKSELTSIYNSHDVMLFPSLHDSGGSVVLESLSHGLPVVCLDIGGPAMIINDACGRVIETKGKNQSAVATSLSDALLKFAEDPHYRLEVAKEAIRRSQMFTWTSVVNGVYRNISLS